MALPVWRLERKKSTAGGADIGSAECSAQCGKRTVLYVLHMGLVRAQAAKVMAQRRKSGMILVVHLVGAL